MTTEATSTQSGIDTTATLGTLTEAVDRAARGATGMNFYSGRGELIEARPYARLREEALDTASRLLAAGLEPGERVAIVAETDGDFACSFFACQYAGLVPAPMPLPAVFGGRAQYLGHLQGMVRVASASAVLAPANLREWVGEAFADAGLRHVGTIAELPPAAGMRLPSVAPDDLAYLQFSSGSTRFPRGIAVTHRAVMANTAGIIRDGLRIHEQDRCASWLPMYHDMGLVGFLLVPVVRAISVDFLPTREFARRPLTWLDLISRNRASLSYAPSFGYELCVRRAERSGSGERDLTSWRVAGIGGDMVRPQPLKHFAETFAGNGFSSRAFCASYGMAEAALALSFAPLNRGLVADQLDSDRLEAEHRAVAASPESRRKRSFVRCGLMLPGHEVVVRDGHGRSLPEGSVGTLFVRGPSLMRGYFNAPEDTAEALDDQGWLNTGDLGYLRDGEIVITGRAKDLILFNGRNIWPQDLEWSAEHEVEGLRSGDVAAISVPAEDGGEDRVVLLFECRPREPEDRARLASDIAGVLSQRHGVDVLAVAVPPRSLPQTSSGKLSRARARRMYLAGDFNEIGSYVTA